MQAYQGYFQDGQFVPIGAATIPERRRVIITVLDEPLPQHDEQIEAFEEFMTAIHASGEKVPEFERVNFTREVEL